MPVFNTVNATIAIYPYSLTSRSALNARSGRTQHRGALIRLGDDPFGYGCIHPWPELGDLDLDQTLALLAKGEFTALSRNALQCARVDAQARAEKRSLFDGLTIPQSHATLLMDESDFAVAIEAGFKTVKVKVGRDLAFETAFIKSQSARYPMLEWRLDFNGVLDIGEVEVFLSELGEGVRDNIDYIEDAYLPNTTPWVNALGPYDIPMAVDRELGDACGGFGIAVIKPAINDVAIILADAVAEGKRVVFTSYMDHPVGQCYAAWQSALANQQHTGILSTCGLVTHGLFEPNEFTEALGKPEPDFHSPTGTGLGFDALLQSLPWTSLS